MGKIVSIASVCLAILIGWAHLGRPAKSANPSQERDHADEGEPKQGNAVRGIVPKRLLPAPPTALGVDDGAKPIAGIKVGPVPDALAAHLGDRVRSGLLALDVAPESAAAKAGLQAFDVVVEVGDAPANRGALQAAIARGGNVRLHIIRNGLDQLITFPAGVAVPEKNEFLSSAAIGADHPFRKLAALGVLLKSYEASANRHEREMRALRRKAHEAERAAEREREALFQRCKADVDKFVTTWRDTLLKRVEERMKTNTPKGLRSLRLTPERLLPAQDVQAVRAAVDRASKTLERMEHLPPATALDKKLTRHRRQRLRHDAGHLADNYRNRLARPWRSSLKSLAKHRRSIDEFVRRLGSSEKAHHQIRVELRERVTCAAKRIKRTFAKRLKRRIRKHEMPKPGEIEASLRAVCGQVDHLADRFLARTDAAVRRAEREWTKSNQRLTRVCDRERPALVDAFTGMDQRLAGLLAAPANAQAGQAGQSDQGVSTVPRATASAWEQRAGVETEVDELSRRLLTAINVSRDETRPPQVTIMSAFHEHRVIDADTRADLECALMHIRSEAANHCWKLDGPHLDGRFPRKTVKRLGNPLIVRARD